MNKTNKSLPPTHLSKPQKTSSKIHLLRNVNIIKTQDKDIFYLRHWKYIGSYTFNLETKQEANQMRRALRRLKYIAKLSNTPNKNLKKPKTYEESFKSSYKTTLKMQNRFTFSSHQIPIFYHKFVNRLVPHKLTNLTEAFSAKCPLSIFINHPNLQFFRFGPIFPSLDPDTIKKLTKLLSRLHKLQVFHVWIEAIDLGQLYNLVKSSSQSIQEILLQTSAFKIEKKPDTNTRLPISFLKISEKGDSQYKVFSLYPNFFKDLKSLSINRIYPPSAIELEPFYHITSLPNITKIDFNFRLNKGSEDIFELFSNLCESRPESLQTISAFFQSNDFLSKSLDDILLGKLNIFQLRYHLQINNKKAHATFSMNFSRPNSLLDLMNPFISTGLESLKIEIDPLGSFVNPLKAEKLIILLSLSSNLKIFSFRSQSLALTKSFIPIKNPQLEEISMTIQEVEYFMKEHFEQFLKALTSIANLKKFHYKTSQSFYYADICQALANFAKVAPSLKLLQVELDVTPGIQEKDIKSFIKSFGILAAKKDLNVELTLKNASHDVQHIVFDAPENLVIRF